MHAAAESRSGEAAPADVRRRSLLPEDAEANPILHMQQTMGNAAVQRFVQRSLADDAERSQKLAQSIAAGDWSGTATSLLQADEPWMVQQLHTLSAEQLRYLDDAVRRMGVRNSRLRIFIHAGLMQLGATDDTAAPGAGFGAIEGKATRIQDGALGDADREATYHFEITFMPNATAVDATLIEFIQMARVVSTVTSEPDPVSQANPINEGANGQARQTAEHARVDRLPGSDEGWFKVGDDGHPKSGLRPWRTGSTAPAWMIDRPGRSEPNVTFDFETAAICREGHDAGTVYATVHWGFTIDAAMKVIPKDTKYYNKESPDFDLAVAFWNAEAGAQGSTQKQLPTNLH